MSRTEKKYLSLDMGNGVSMRLVRIPADNDGAIDAPFWMGCCEVTNRQYAQFDPRHDSRFEHRGSWIFSEEYLGWPLDAPDQPVIRVSWEEANAFCEASFGRTGRHIRLPTEREWEYACRAGTTTPFWFGRADSDFTPYANLADKSLRQLAADSWGPKPPDLAARDDRFDDGHLVTAPVGSFTANPFGLYDMHGNVAEWTQGQYESKRRAVRGGSWRDLPAEARASERFGYQPFQRVFNVGFRVVCEDDHLADADSP
jgi:formylglycine-generating enzyme required for sulfatase activity